MTTNPATINAINEETSTLSTNDPNLISTLKGYYYIKIFLFLI